MDISKFTQDFTEIIRRAEHADKDGLRLLRAEIIKILDRVGHKNFVTLTANILKNKFCIEGCNDARLPLKRIFTVSPDKLGGDSSMKKIMAWTKNILCLFLPETIRVMCLS